MCRHFASSSFPRHERAVVELLTLLLSHASSPQMGDGAASVLQYLTPMFRDPRTTATFAARVVPAVATCGASQTSASESRCNELLFVVSSNVSRIRKRPAVTDDQPTANGAAVSVRALWHTPSESAAKLRSGLQMMLDTYGVARESSASPRFTDISISTGGPRVVRCSLSFELCFDTGIAFFWFS